MNIKLIKKVNDAVKIEVKSKDISNTEDITVKYTYAVHKIGLNKLLMVPLTIYTDDKISSDIEVYYKGRHTDDIKNIPNIKDIFNNHPEMTINMIQEVMGHNIYVNGNVETHFIVMAIDPLFESMDSVFMGTVESIYGQAVIRPLEYNINTESINSTITRLITPRSSIKFGGFDGNDGSEIVPL